MQFCETGKENVVTPLRRMHLWKMNEIFFGVAIVMGAHLFGATPFLKPVKWHTDKSDITWLATQEGLISNARASNSFSMMDGSFALSSRVLAYLATRRTTYIDQAISIIEPWIHSSTFSSNISSSQYKDVFMGWVGGASGESPLYEGYYWRQVAHLLRVMQQDGMHTNQGYLEKWTKIRAFLENHVWGKWFDRKISGNAPTWARTYTHMASHGGVVALFGRHLFANTNRISQCETLLNIYFGGEGYLPYSTMSGLNFLTMMGDHSALGSDGISFPQPWNALSPIEDTSHANHVVSLFTLTQMDGFLPKGKFAGWLDPYLARFFNTFANYIIVNTNSFNLYISASGSQNSVFLSEGWLALSVRDPLLQKSFTEGNIPSANNGPESRHQWYMQGAYNAFLLATIAPTVSVSVGTLTTNKAFMVALAATDNNGYFSTNGSAFVSFTTAGTNLTIDHTTTLSLYGRDGLGNISATNTQIYTFDTTAPTVSVSVGTLTTNKAFAVALTVSEQSGLFSTNAGVTWVAFPPTGTNFIVSNTVTLRVFARDSAGNTSATNTTTYTIDLTAPLVGVSPAGCLTNAVFTATLSTTKNFGYWSTNGGVNWWQYGTGGTNVEIRGSSTLLYFGRDGAGKHSATNRADYLFLPMLTRFTARTDAHKGLLVLLCEADKGVNEGYGLAFSFRPTGTVAWTPIPDGALLAPVTHFSVSSTTNLVLVSNLSASNFVDLRAVSVIAGMEGRELSIRGFDFSVFGGLQDDLSKVCALNNPYRGEVEGIQLLNLSGDSKVTVHSISGRLLIELPPVTSRGAISWNARDKVGKPVTAGTYLVRVVSAKGERVIPLMVMP